MLSVNDLNSSGWAFIFSKNTENRYFFHLMHLEGNCHLLKEMLFLSDVTIESVFHSSSWLQTVTACKQYYWNRAQLFFSCSLALVSLRERESGMGGNERERAHVKPFLIAGRLCPLARTKANGNWNKICQMKHWKQWTLFNLAYELCQLKTHYISWTWAKVCVCVCMCACACVCSFHICA